MYNYLANFSPNAFLNSYHCRVLQYIDFIKWDHQQICVYPMVNTFIIIGEDETISMIWFEEAEILQTLSFKHPKAEKEHTKD